MKKDLELICKLTLDKTYQNPTSFSVMVDQISNISLLRGYLFDLYSRSNDFGVDKNQIDLIYKQKIGSINKSSIIKDLIFFRESIADHISIDFERKSWKLRAISCILDDIKNDDNSLSSLNEFFEEEYREDLINDIRCHLIENEWYEQVNPFDKLVEKYQKERYN